MAGQSLSDWLRQYGRERTRRQQGEEVARFLAERLPDMFAATTRPLNPQELEDVAAEMLACGERLLSGLSLAPALNRHAA